MRINILHWVSIIFDLASAWSTNLHHLSDHGDLRPEALHKREADKVFEEPEDDVECEQDPCGQVTTIVVHVAQTDAGIKEDDSEELHAVEEVGEVGPDLGGEQMVV